MRNGQPRSPFRKRTLQAHRRLTRRVAALAYGRAVVSILAVTATVFLLPAGAGGQQATVDDRVDALFARWNSAAVPGCAVGVSRAGRMVLARAYGMADLEHDVPNTPATIFEAGSVAKQFTAAAVVMLALDGRLSLDEPVRKYIPELPDYGVPLTIRHMMNHTSGLRDWGSLAGIAGSPRGSRVHTHAHVLDIVSRQRALNFEPGNQYSYSNTGYNLQAIIVERVSGMSFSEFSRQRLFEPLGLENTQWRDDFTRIVPGRAVGYAQRGTAFAMDMPFENVHGNGGLLTTVEDLLTWNENLVTGRVGGARFIEMMHEQGVLNDGSRIAYALGLSVGRRNGVPEVSHTGATAGYRAYLSRYPEQQFGVALLCNVGAVNPGSVGQQVADLFLTGPAQADAGARPTPAANPAAQPPRAPAAQPQRPVLSAAQLEQYAGEYYSAEIETTFTVVVEGGALVLLRRPASRIMLQPAADDAFQGSLGRIRFLRDGAGGITGMALAQDRVFDLRFARIR